MNRNKMHVHVQHAVGTENADCAYNASGYPEDRCVAGDLAAESSPANSVDVILSTVIPKRITPAVSSSPVHSAYPV
jgi:hypothetical protein